MGFIKKTQHTPFGCVAIFHWCRWLATRGKILIIFHLAANFATEKHWTFPLNRVVEKYLTAAAAGSWTNCVSFIRRHRSSIARISFDIYQMSVVIWSCLCTCCRSVTVSTVIEIQMISLTRLNGFCRTESGKGALNRLAVKQKKWKTTHWAGRQFSIGMHNINRLYYARPVFSDRICVLLITISRKTELAQIRTTFYIPSIRFTRPIRDFICFSSFSTKLNSDNTFFGRFFHWFFI